MPEVLLLGEIHINPMVEMKDQGLHTEADWSLCINSTAFYLKLATSVSFSFFTCKGGKNNGYLVQVENSDYVVLSTGSVAVSVFNK